MNKKSNWYKEAVVYQIYPFSYMDANNDGIGDIEGIISKLDYIRDLGVTAIWFSPLYPSPWKDYGYDISDYRGINPKFGTMADFDRLVDECHKRGLRVIMDMVVNHTSDQHEWFRAALEDVRSECEKGTEPGEVSKYRDYYIFEKGKPASGTESPAAKRMKMVGTGKLAELKREKNITSDGLLPPTNWTSSFTGTAWERVEGTDYFYLHLFTVEQPDLNWENPAVRQEIVDVLNFWMDKGVDGFRFDVFNLFSKVYPFKDDNSRGGFQKGTPYFVDGPRMHEFLKQLNSEALALHDSYTVGESYFPDEEEAYKYIREDSAELDTIFNFKHLESDNLNGMKYIPKPFSLKEFKEGFFGTQKKYFDGAWNTLVLENHDNSRSNSRFGINTDKYRYEASTFLATITFLGWGVPFIYQGEEIGMTNVDFKSIDDMKDPVSHFIYDLVTGYGMPGKAALKMIKTGARDNARVPMQWTSGSNAGFNAGAKPWQCVNPNYKTINVEADLKNRRSVYRYYQDLLKIKKENKVAIYGDVTELCHKDRNIIAYSREYEGKRLLVVGNFSAKNVKFELPQGFRGKKIILKNYEYVVPGQTITLRPYEAIVFEE